MVGFWINKFYTNKSSTLIEYKRIDDIKDFIYPELSICFATPFITDEFRDKGFQETYRAYLQGEGFNDISWTTLEGYYKNFTYDYVTPNLSEYLKSLTIKWKEESNRSVTFCNKTESCDYVAFNNIYNGYSDMGRFYKCFGVSIKHPYAKDIVNIFFLFKSEFQSVVNQVGMVLARFYQPNQFIRGLGVHIPIWTNSDIGTNYFDRADAFEVNSVEILKRRDTHNSRCYQDWKDYDNWVLKRFLGDAGCRPLYIDHNMKIPSCKTREEMKKASYNGWSFVGDNRMLNPCQEMPFINVQHVVYRMPIENKTEKHYSINIQYPPASSISKIVTESKAVDVHSLIGNIGGYIGLFLGEF